MSFAVIAIIFLIVRLLRDWHDNQPVLELKATVRPNDPDPSAPGIYDLIIAQAALDPERPLDYVRFPDLPTHQERIHFPGAYDLLEDRPRTGPDSGRNQILACLDAVRRRHITDWRVLELYVRDTDPYIYRDAVLKGLPLSKIPPGVRTMFQQMAFNSADYTAVKWGIIIGSIRASDEEIEALMELARHAELTSYVCRSLIIEKKRNPAIVHRLVDLLQITDGWGFFHVFHYVVETPELIEDPWVQRLAVIHGMRKGEHAQAHLALLFTGRLFLSILFKTAEEDRELAAGLIDMLTALLLEPKPPGLLGADPDGEALLDRFMGLIDELPPSIDTIRGVRALIIAMSSEELPWPTREERLKDAYERFYASVTPDLLAAAIREDDQRWDALRIIAELEIEPLLPVVLEDFLLRPDAMNIEVLGRLGEGEHLHVLFNALPDDSEIARRAAVSPDAETIDPELLESSANYAAIIQHMGKLEGPASLARIKSAAADFHPWVRAGAITAMRSIQRWTLDAESRNLVQAGLEDSFDIVRDAARETAAYHNLKVTIDGASGLILSEEFGVSLN